MTHPRFTQVEGRGADPETQTRLQAQSDELQRQLLQSRRDRARVGEELRRFELDPTQLKVDESVILGTGASATVYRGTYNFESVAVKVRCMRASAWNCATCATSRRSSMP